MPDKKRKPDPKAQAKADLFKKKAAADAELKAKRPTVTAVPRSSPGNPHDQFIADLIQGLQDGSIILRSVDARRVTTHPHTELMVELWHTGQPTLPAPGPTGATGAAGTMGATGATMPRSSVVPPTSALARQITTAVTAAMSSSAMSSMSMVQKVASLPGATSYGLKSSKSVEPIVGYRDFKLVQGQLGYSLQSRNGAVWPHRRKMQGLCGGNPFASHDVPEPSCACGIYAYDDPGNTSLTRDNSFLWGEIAMWGEVLVCDTGYRAEFAYPTALFMRKAFTKNNRSTRVMEAVREELEDNYGVPVFILAERASKTASQLMQEILQEQLGILLNEPKEEE
jgi:hypothetical protein